MKSKTFWQFTINPTLDDQIRLTAFAKLETQWYNRLNSVLSKMLKTNSDVLSSLTSDDVIAFGEMCRTGLDATTEQKYNSTICKFKNHVSLLDLADYKINIHRYTRGLMARQMMDFYRHQATIKMSSNTNHDQIYRVSFMSLENLSMDNKRHLQLSRDYVVVKESLLFTPYTKESITVDGNIEKLDWNYIIIRQLPGKNINRSTPWQVVLRKMEKEEYLLHFVESSAPTKVLTGRHEKSVV
ncbi:MAG: hypothetical protein WC284_14700 [Candidimonas sp.]